MQVRTLAQAIAFGEVAAQYQQLRREHPTTATQSRRTSSMRRIMASRSIASDCSSFAPGRPRRSLLTFPSATTVPLERHRLGRARLEQDR